MANTQTQRSRFHDDQVSVFSMLKNPILDFNHDWGHFITQSTIILTLSTRIMSLCLCGYLALVLPSNRNQTSHSPVLWLSLETSTAPTQFLKNIFFLVEIFSDGSAAALHVDCHKPIQYGSKRTIIYDQEIPMYEN